MADTPQKQEIAQEIWGLVISQPILTGKDLKCLRLVCTFFNDFATPQLFKNVSFSVVRENLHSLYKIGKRRELADMVDSISIDNSMFNPFPSINDYCANAAAYFELFVGPQDDGPLTERNLRTVMSASPVTTFADDCYLSEPLRSAFQEGFRLNHARSQYRLEFESHNPKKRVLKLLEPFKNLRTIELHHLWHRHDVAVEPKGSRMFKAYLKKHLPTIPFERISGLTEEDKRLDTSMVPTSLSFFVGPGPAARNMNPMWVPTIYQPRKLTHTAGFPFHHLISALKVTDIHIENLLLPSDPDNARHPYSMGSHNYGNYIHPALLIRDAGWPSSGPAGVLVPFFASLKYLNLRIDPIVHLGMFPAFVYDHECITLGIQALHKIEELHLAFRTASREERAAHHNFVGTETWTIKAAFLSGLIPKESLEEVESSDDDDDDDDDAAGNTAPLPPMMALWNGPPQQILGNATGAYPAGAIVPVQLFPAAQHPKPDPRPKFYDVLPVNPWPKLRVLSLVSLSTSLPDAVIFFKTIAQTLQSLTIVDVRMLGSCKNCHQNHRHRSQHDTEDPCYDYLDLVVALTEFMTFKDCVLRVPAPDCYVIAKRMGWQAVDSEGERVDGQFEEIEAKIASMEGHDFNVVKENINKILEECFKTETPTEMWDLIHLLDGSMVA